MRCIINNKVRSLSSGILSHFSCFVYLLLILGFCNPLIAQYGAPDLKDRIFEFNETIQEEFILNIDFSNLEEIQGLESFEDLADYLDDEFDITSVNSVINTFIQYCEDYDSNNGAGSAVTFITTNNGDGPTVGLPPCFETYYNTQNVLIGSLAGCCLAGISCPGCTGAFLLASAANHANYLYCMSGY